jgi:hypothetical protein
MDVTVSAIRDNDGTMHLANSLVLVIERVNRLGEDMIRVRFEDGHVYLLHSDEIKQAQLCSTRAERASG